MANTFTLSFVLVVAATSVAGLPSIHARICDDLDITPIALGMIQVWSAAGNLGYLTPAFSNVLGG